MRTHFAALLAALLTCGFIAFTASAHPGSGIVVDHKGQVLFVHTGVGILKPDGRGGATRVAGPGFHFMNVDRASQFVRQRWPKFPDGEIKVTATSPTLLLSSSFPLVVGSDGALYYPEAARDGHVHLMRLMPAGEPATFAVLPTALEIGQDGKEHRARWIHGLAVGPEGSFYYSEQRAVRRVGQDGTVSMVASNLTVPDCVRPREEWEVRLGPVLRGLAVASDGTVYVAASGCSAVVKIAPAGSISVVLRASDAWAPTGVALNGDDLYVLEFRHIQTERAQDWLPRVRKVARDGAVMTIATVTQPPR